MRDVNRLSFYKTGDIAKKANVTVRTIQYYDSIGLLHPSIVDEKGYRFYNNEDLEKLKKILFLKSLGFSLDEIRTMTATDSFTSLKDAVHYQIKSIDKKINTLTLIKENLESFASNPNWDSIMNSIKLNEFENDILEQYKNSTNIDIRIKLHKLYSQREESWFRWLYSNYDICSNSKVLELGCGNGNLWKENIDRIVGKITLSDISKGMIDDAKDNLGQAFDYKIIDAHSIPYEDNTFDIVIANHMLFYSMDIDKVLQEVKRVLKPNGIFYSTTYSSHHMQEITSLVKEFNPRINLSNISLFEIFGLENGKTILNKYFNNVDIKLYKDSLEVTNCDDLLNYILSCHGNQNEYIMPNIDNFKELIIKKFKSGSFHITKEAVLFTSIKH